MGKWRSPVWVLRLLARVSFATCILQLSFVIASGQPQGLLERKITDDYLVSKWTTSEGLPQNTVTAIVQTRDGYLWLGTFGGLARFDGVKFTVFDSTNTPGFAANRVLSLYVDSLDRLWIGTDSGEVYFVAGGQLFEFASGSAAERRQVWGINEDASGSIFISSVGGIESFKPNNVGQAEQETYKILLKINSYGLFRDAHRRVWAKLDTGVVLLDEQTVTSGESLGVEFPASVFDMAFDSKGDAIVGASLSLGTIAEGNYSEISKLDPSVHRDGFAVAAIDDSFWFQQTDELLKIGRTETIKYRLSDFVVQGSRTMLRDSEGNIWLATQADGLVRLKAKTLGSVTEMLGRDALLVYSVVEDLDGAIWLAGTALYKIVGDRIQVIDRVIGQSGFPRLQSVAVDSKNRLWAGGQIGLYRMEDRGLVPIEAFGNDNIQALFFDRDDNMWIGTEHGLARYSAGSIIRFSTDNGLVSPRVHVIKQAGDGSIWIGTSRGVSRFFNGTFSNITSQQDLPNEYVRDIVEDVNGDIWFATYGGGLIRYKDGRFASVTRTNGLLNNFVSRLIIDDEGHFWALTNLGVFCTTREELNRVADGANNLLGGAVYDVSDGMKTSEGNGGHQPAGYLARDGRLWFPMISDVVSIDPKSFGHEPPKIIIENAKSLDKTESQPSLPLRFNVGELLKVETGLRNLQIEYTGLSYSKPEAIRFVYKLEGLDTDWIDAGTRRTAFYPFLPAGDYTFLVRAQSANGTWSTATASLAIRVEPKFYETWWFALIAVISVIMIAAYIYLDRVRSLDAKRLEQIRFSRELIKAGEVERARIAKEIHDGISQNLLVIKNWARTGQDSTDEAGTRAKEYLAKAVSLASNSLDETRTIIDNLVPQNLSRFGLTESITNLTENAEDAFGIVFETEIENIDGLFDDETQLSIYRIIQEAINNIVKHSESPRAVIRINKIPGNLILSVRDFGVGMDFGEIQARDGRGFGLRNIRERVKMIGGSVTFISPADSGTEVFIKIPIEDENEDKSTDR